MPTFRLITQADLDALLRMADQVAALAERFKNSGRLVLGGVNAGPAPKPRPTAKTNRAEARDGKKYKIVRGASGLGYVDIVNAEMPDQQIITLDEVWEKVGPLIDTDSKRPRDALRTALTRSDEFARIKNRDDVAWRRKSPAETSGEAGTS